MIEIQLDEKIILSLICGTLEERIDFFSDKDVIRNLDILTIKIIYQKTIDRAEKDDDYLDVLTLLQALAYNRDKSKYKDEIADFVFDKLFELVTEGDLL
jgi:hypothetical protein